jgi:hypothetical protein
MRQILGRAITIAGEEGSEQENKSLLEPNYEAFRSVEDLTETAQALYKAAGKSLSTTSKASKAHQLSRSHLRLVARRNSTGRLHVGTENTRLANGST